MPTTIQPFAENAENAAFDGVINFASGGSWISIGTPTAGFTSTGLKWYNGPDAMADQYIIAYLGQSRNTPDGSQSRLNFLGTNALFQAGQATPELALTDQKFLELVNTIQGSTGFTEIVTALEWLSANGYWTNYNGVGGGGSGITWTATNFYDAQFNGSVWDCEGMETLILYTGSDSKIYTNQVEFAFYNTNPSHGIKYVEGEDTQIYSVVDGMMTAVGICGGGLNQLP